MRNLKRLAEIMTVGNSKPLFVVTFVTLALLLAGCSKSSNKNEVSISDGQLSTSIPSALMALTIDSNNLVIELVDSLSVVQAACTDLVVNQLEGTFSCNITLPAGAYTLGLNYSIVDVSYGKILVAVTTGINIDVTAGTTSVVDFSTVTVSYDFDGDGDGINNLAELDAGTDPNDDVCILDQSLINNCALG